MSKDFHGGRTYAADSHDGSPGFGFGVALKFAWLKAQLANLFGLARAAADGSQEAAPSKPKPTPANDAERDAELRLVSMFQVFDGPGNAATRFGGSHVTRRQAETQDR